MNITLAKNILDNLAQQGMRTVCLCPGARNAPFVELLSRNDFFETIGFYDERSAGFFALGRARRDQRPVGVITTSGTAVAELLPAVIEASYTETPLVVLSADRPKRLRGSGAPQSIEQSQIFSGYVENPWDIASSEKRLDFLIETKPFHINVCFDEPLLDEPLDQWQVKDERGYPTRAFKDAPFLNIHLEKALFVLGSLNTDERQAIEENLSSFEVPVFAEASSGLKASKKLAPQLIGGGEKIVSQMIKSGDVQTVIRIGDIPLGRFWRDLDQLPIKTMSFSSKPWKGTEKSEIYHCDLSQLKLESLKIESWNWLHWKTMGDEKQVQIENLLQEHPLSEPSFFKTLESVMKDSDSLYLGNSLPVRLWDMVSNKSTRVRSNRGANGIDGQVSSAFGWMAENSNNWVVLGDLTSLYDFNGFWVSPYLKEKQMSVNLVVVNNGGGQIFSRIFDNKLFQNSHQLNFKGLADTWGWNYQKIESPESLNPQSGLNLIEWTPDSEQSEAFWKRYDSLWKK